jgi:hypothetical protein
MIASAGMNNALITVRGANYKIGHVLPVPDDTVVKDIVEETIDEYGMTDKYNRYIRTDHITEPDRHARGLLVHFSEQGNNPYTLDTRDVVRMICDSWAHSLPHTTKCHVSSMNPVNLAKLKVENTSTGNFSKDPRKKKECAIEVSGIVSSMAQTGLAKCGPNKPNIKLEVIVDYDDEGKPKKARATQSDDAVNALAAEACFGTFIRLSPGVEGGSAIKVPTHGGYGMRLFRHLTRPISNSLKIAEEEALKRGLHESDKKSWEATTKPETSYAYAICAISAVADLSEAGAVAANVLAHYHHPFFSITGDQACSKPGVTASGSKPTAHGNTMRHGFMLALFKWYVLSHDRRLGKHGCDCKDCVVLSDHEDFGKKIDDLELQLLLQAVLMGDDFICVWNDASCFYDYYCDRVFGTVTKSGREEFGEGAFLKRRMKKVRGFWSTYVHEDQAIPKLAGPRGFQAESKMAQCINIAVNANNRKVYDICKTIYMKIEDKFGRSLAVDEELKEGFKGINDCDGFPSWNLVEARHLPLPEELAMSNLNHHSVMATNLPFQMTM